MFIVNKIVIDKEYSCELYKIQTSFACNVLIHYFVDLIS